VRAIVKNKHKKGITAPKDPVKNKKNQPQLSKKNSKNHYKILNFRLYKQTDYQYQEKLALI